MASLLVKRVASNLSRVRTIASSSRFFSCQGYQYVQHDAKGECILKFDDKNASSLVRGVVNDAFNPHVSPTQNLARLLNFADWRVKCMHGTSQHRWNVVEDDQSLCIFRDMTERFNQDAKESVPIPKEEVVWETVLPTRNVFPVIDIMRGKDYTPGEYYHHVMKDANEVNQFVDSLGGEVLVNFRIQMYAIADDPKAFYIFLLFGDTETCGPYGGYAVEILLEDSLYDVYGVKRDLTGEHRKMVIPKKKSMEIGNIGGNIIFFCEKKFYKPAA